VPRGVLSEHISQKEKEEKVCPDLIGKKERKI
jgi:hypothetical protein